MLLPKFEYHEPTTLEEVCQIMSELGHRAKPLAGGTDLIVNMKKKMISPGHLVSLSLVDDLKKIDTSTGLLKIGACITAAELAESTQIRETLTALSRGAESLGSPLIRNLATLGGNLITARPAADLPPARIAYGAKVLLKNSSGERLISLDDLFLGPGETLIGPDEILTEIQVDSPPPGAGAAYIKLGVRETLEISLVNVAAFMSMDEDGSIQEARIVLGSVAPTPMRAGSAERILANEKPSETLFSRAGEAASKDCKPIDDFRASAEYKRAMVEVLTKRALNQALSKVKDKG
jgi:CO/xanthine dehydrogenase FAD-binding subunit